MALEQSILKSTKKMLGIGDDDESFDLDIITHINSAFSHLNDLGVGPEDGFVIDDDSEEWDDFLPDADTDGKPNLVKLSKVKTVVFIRTKMVFDPSASSYLQDSMEKLLQEAEWRLSTNRESTDWVDPSPPALSLESGGQGE
jgi:hypothetical protein